MELFAERGYRVRYVEQLGIRNPSPRHAGRLLRGLIGREPAGGGDARSSRLDVVSPKLLPPRRAPGVDALNRRWLARQLLSALEDPAEAIFWVRFPTPELLPAIEAAGPALVVYEAVDDHAASPGMTARLQRLFRESEQRLLERAGLVFAWSEPLREDLAARHPNVVLAPAAVDLGAFSSAAAEPGRERVAGFAGAIDFRFDAELVAAAARRLPDWTFVLAGPVMGDDGERLAELPNVELPGPLPREQVPDLLAGARVCLMPYRRNAFADMLFPVKLVEYLAAGRAVVSTPVRAVREFADVVALAEGPEEFAAAIAAAGGAAGPEDRARRVERVQEYSWTRRIDQMEGAIQEALRRA